MDPSSAELWASLGAIVVANLLLSGDNAIVIAMAARALPPRQRRLAVFWGSVAAIALRIVLTIAAVSLLQLPWLKIAGAVALLWIGVQLFVQGKAQGPVAGQLTLAAAIRTILAADLAMSLDNVIAVAGAADSAPERYQFVLVVIGLAMSVPVIIAGSTLLIRVMDRFPLVPALGAAMLGYLAGQMLVTDPAAEGWLARHVPQADLLLGAACALLVVGVGRLLRSRRSGAGPA